MRDEEERDIVDPPDPVDQPEHGRLHRHVERRRRLVENEEARVRDQGTGDRGAGLLAAGELMRPAAEKLGARGRPRRRSVERALRCRVGSRVRPRPVAMLRRIEKAGLRASSACWKTSWIERRAGSRAKRLAGMSVMSRPSKRIVPSLGSISRAMSRASVDLPEPLSPTTPMLSPASSVRSTPSTA